MNLTPVTGPQNRPNELQAPAHMPSAPHESLGELPSRPSLPNVSAQNHPTSASGPGDAEPSDKPPHYSARHSGNEVNESKRDSLEPPLKKRRRLYEEGEDYRNKTYPEPGAHLEKINEECEVSTERYDNDAVAGNASPIAESHRRSPEHAQLDSRNNAVVDGNDNNNDSSNNRCRAAQQRKLVRLSCNLFRQPQLRNEENLKSPENREQKAPAAEKHRKTCDFDTNAPVPAVCINQGANSPKRPSVTLRSKPAPFPSDKLGDEDNRGGKDAVGNENVHTSVGQVLVNSHKRAPTSAKVHHMKTRERGKSCNADIKRKAASAGAQNRRGGEKKVPFAQKAIKKPSSVKQASKKKGESTKIIIDHIVSSELHPALLDKTTFRAALPSSFRVTAVRAQIDNQFELLLSQLMQSLQVDRDACPLPILHLCASVETIARSCGSVLIVNACYVDREWNLRKLLLGIQPIKNRDIKVALAKILNEHKLEQSKHIAGVTINGELRDHLYGAPLIPDVPQDQCIDDGLCTALCSAFTSSNDVGHNSNKNPALFALKIAVELASDKNFASGQNAITEGLIRDAECCISGLKGPHWRSLPDFLHAVSQAWDEFEPKRGSRDFAGIPLDVIDASRGTVSELARITEDLGDIIALLREGKYASGAYLLVKIEDWTRQKFEMRYGATKLAMRVLRGQIDNLFVMDTPLHPNRRGATRSFFREIGIALHPALKKMRHLDDPALCGERALIWRELARYVKKAAVLTCDKRQLEAGRQNKGVDKMISNPRECDAPSLAARPLEPGSIDGNNEVEVHQEELSEINRRKAQDAANEAIAELERYEGSNTVTLDEFPLKETLAWWKCKEEVYPCLSSAAKSILGHSGACDTGLNRSGSLVSENVVFYEYGRKAMLLHCWGEKLMDPVIR